MAHTDKQGRTWEEVADVAQDLCQRAADAAYKRKLNLTIAMAEQAVETAKAAAELRKLDDLEADKQVCETA